MRDLQIQHHWYTTFFGSSLLVLELGLEVQLEKKALQPTMPGFLGSVP